MNKLFDKDFNIELLNIKTKIDLIKIKSKNDFCIYTCLIGGMDVFTDIDFPTEGYDSFIITDDSAVECLNSHIILIDIMHRSDRRTNRVFKLLPHLFFSSYNTSLYYDTNLIFKTSPLKFLKSLKLDSNFAIFNHNKRDCLFDEIDECLFWNKDSNKILNTQKNNYVNNSMPRNFGLFLGSVLIRNHNEIKKFSELWWEEYDNFSARDQISLAYTVFKEKLCLEIIDIKFFYVFFNKKQHLKINVNESKLTLIQKIKFKALNVLVKLKNKLC